MKREIGEFIEDIISAMNKALQFVDGMSFVERFGGKIGMMLAGLGTLRCFALAHIEVT